MPHIKNIYYKNNYPLIFNSLKIKNYLSLLFKNLSSLFESLKNKAYNLLTSDMPHPFKWMILNSIYQQ